MKRVFFILLFALVCYSTYYDLTTGSLPATMTSATALVPPPEKEINQEVVDQVNGLKTIEVQIEPGDTVLSIIERIHQGPVKASINQIIYDFQILNNDIDPNEIQIGEIYLFPLYTQ